MNHDDPKFTAYALDELDPAERTEIEQLLAEDPAALAEIEQTRAFAEKLRAELKSEAAEPLRDEQRAEVLAARVAQSSQVPEANIVPFWRRTPILSVLAASVVVAVGWGMFFQAAQWKRADSLAATSEVSIPTPQISVEEEIAQSPVDSAAPAEPNLPTTAKAPALASAPKASALQEPSDKRLFELYSSEGLKIDEPRRDLEKSLVASNSGVTTMTLPAASPALSTAPPSAPSAMASATASRMGGASEPSRQLVMSAAPATRKKEAYTRWQSQAGIADSITVQDSDQTQRFEASGVVARREPESPSRSRVDAVSRESYDGVTDNAFLRVADQPLSTFSIDVDTASYANVRRFLNSNTLPPKAAVRIEELVNYFTYDYPQPEGDVPFSSTMEVATCPWTPEHRLVRIGLKGREMKRDQRPASNLVFLVDVSGSMQPENKLPLLKQSMQLLVDQLTPRDQVSIVVYAGASGLVLEPTRDKAEIRQALSRLESGGSTNGAAGIQLAYDTARRAFIKDGTNRVILATDGDFNVGVTSQNELVELIQREAKSGVFLTVLGFGMDNLKDSTLEKLANKGNGNYAYIDTLNEGRRVLVEQMGGTLVTIAKDVKIQVEFNPAQVGAYRLIGYENRLLAKEDFNDDTKDAGEIGAGHSVTALYEIVPAGKPLPSGEVDELKYQTAQAQPRQESAADAGPQKPASAEFLTLKLRYKAPDADVSRKLEFPLIDSGATWEKSSHDFRFGAAVASYGMLLRDSPYKGRATWNSTLELAAEGKGEDASGYRAEFIGLVEKARALSR